ncbi:hypothetical protein [Corallococcus silvisoli]|uniref:hypothetical protein n=1 Tax=Corallococcus silvisoli TaxID=2697031 RepID=UPI001376E263|nr:hypothetical protein [Corallococcus silvisoli]NBD12327.1 hypothetical protein [Corallococcus silvisoli]
MSGTLTDLDGQVMVAPRVLMQALDNGTILITQAVMGLRDGGFLVLVLERVDSPQQGVLRLQRFDADLNPVGEPRTFSSDAYPDAELVELGAGAGGPLESPVMVLRSQQGGTQAIRVLGNLFGEVTTQTLAVTTPGEVPWFGVATTSRRLQVGWLSEFRAPEGGGSMFDWWGRFWGLGHGGSPMDWTPGPAPLSLHRYSQWVRLEELPENWMGALVMTSTQSPESHTLQAVRYCAP